MTRLRLPILLTLAAATLLVACGRKGDPLPPLRYIPTPARDLSLHQQGGVFILNMGYPQTTTTGLTLPGLDEVEVWWLRAPNAGTLELDARTFAARSELLLGLRGAELSSSVIGDRIETRFPIPPEVESADQLVFATRSVSSTGEPSDYSNLVQIRFAPAPAPPTGLELTPLEEGVRLDWNAPDDVAIHVFRRPATARRYGGPLRRLDAGTSTFVDTGVNYGRRYIYAVRSIAGADPLVESDPSAEREIEYRDVFAPAPPQSVVALGEVGGARLVLEESPTADTAGYVIYRQDPEADFRRVNDEPHPRLEFRDSGLTPGLTYRYYVTAVDAAGNEGEPSRVVTVTLQQ